MLDGCTVLWRIIYTVHVRYRRVNVMLCLCYNWLHGIRRR